jgi:hypothetical protein
MTGKREPVLKSKEVRSIAVDREVWKLAEAAAEKHKLSVSQYVQSCILWDLVEEGNLQAMKMCMALAKTRIKKKLASFGFGRASESA